MIDIQNKPILRVVKVGGSLFKDSQFAVRLRDWLESSGNCQSVLVAGGGQPVNCVRDWHRRFSLTEDHAHHASIRMMSETARLLAVLLGPVPLVTAIRDIPLVFADCQNLVLDCQEFMKEESGLERSWRSTSDSIAAEVAVHLQADELWLLKSTQPCTGEIDEWQRAELVDPNFARTADPLKRVVMANFSNDDLLSVDGN